MGTHCRSRRPRRFIPARAGNTRGCAWRRSLDAVHPRASGEHQRVGGRNGGVGGSSPRERGTPPQPHPPPHGHRFIPARAGNTCVVGECPAGHSVHPRASGEHAQLARWRSGARGSSPRERGTQTIRRRIELMARFIPARAGNTAPRRSLRSPTPVHPRASGEHVDDVALGAGADRFIPARAGNTQLRGHTPPGAAVHPRASGEHSASLNVSPKTTGSSPRERGTRPPSMASLCASRFIPARAGNTAGDEGDVGAAAVHPRASGEHCCTLAGLDLSNGSSPRERGTRLLGRGVCLEPRFIPARAGNTKFILSALA